MHGNPWFRLLRREVAALVKKKYGASLLTDQKTKTELAKVNLELKRIKTRAKDLEARKTTGSTLLLP